MNISDSITQARKAGYSDAEIAAYIAKDPGMGSKVGEARKAGYSDGEIIDHLASPSLMARVKDAGTQYISGVKQGASQLADMVTTAASPAGFVGRMSAGNPFGLASPTNIVGNLFSRVLAGHEPQAQTKTGEFARTLGQMTPNALAPGSAAARIANVVIPAATTEGAGQLARAAGAGPKGEQAARAVGSVVGAGVASIRPRNPFAPEATPAETIAARAPQDPAALQQRANDFRQAGIQPTLSDVVDDAGRGQIRAAANRPTPGRDVANVFARARSLDLPSRIGNQARTTVSADPRTPAAIAEQLGQQRASSAANAFGAVRGDAVDLGAEGLSTLRTPDVVTAIEDAARRERDPTVRAALGDLHTWASGTASTGMAPPITVGMADRISRVLLGKAGATQDRDLGATLRMFGEGIRGPARQASPGYATALKGYADQSKLMDAASQGEDFLARNTDEFVANTPAPGQPGNELARATARRAIERAAGENPSSAPGLARRLAEAPEQQARNAHLLGPHDAQRFQQGMRLEAQAVDNANMVAPRTGSPTHLNDTDAARLGGMLQTGHRVLRQDWVGLGMDWLRSRGLSDQDAEGLVRMATDPAQTDAAIAAITRRLGPEGARPFLQWRNAGLIGAAAGTMAATRPTPGQQPQDPGRR